MDINFPDPVNIEEHFFGRDEIWQEIQRCFLGTSPRPVMLFGERGSGKTSLLQIAIQRMVSKSNGTLVPIFLPVSSSSPTHNFLETLVIQEVQKRTGISPKSDDIKKPENSIEVAEYLRAILPKAGKNIFVICIDGLDLLLQPLSHYGLADEIRKSIDLLDILIRKRHQLKINLFITLSTIPEVLHSPDVLNKILGASRFLELPPFSAVETSKFIQAILKDHVHLPNKTIQQIYHYSGGNPYTTKIVLDTLLQQKILSHNAIKKSPIMVDQAVNLAAVNLGYSGVFQNIFENYFSIQERALALLITLANRPITLNEIRLLGAQFITAANSLTRRAYFHKEEQQFFWRMHFIPQWLRNWDRYAEEIELLNIYELLDILDVDIWIDKTIKKVFFKQEPIQLSNRQYEILECLCIYEGKLVTHEQISSHLWQPNDLDVNTNLGAISMAISRLRKKFCDDSRSPRYIETVPGQGYILRHASFVRKVTQ